MLRLWRHSYQSRLAFRLRSRKRDRYTSARARRSGIRRAAYSSSGSAQTLYPLFPYRLAEGKSKQAVRSLIDLAYSIFRAKDQKRQLAEELTRHRFQDQKSDYSNARAPRNDKHGGYIAIDGVVKAQTIQCAHCPAHWVMRTGSGIVRGFCGNCMRPTCGDRGCDRCVTWEQKLQMIERRARGL